MNIILLVLGKYELKGYLGISPSDLSASSSLIFPSVHKSVEATLGQALGSVLGLCLALEKSIF